MNEINNILKSKNPYIGAKNEAIIPVNDINKAAGIQLNLN